MSLLFSPLSIRNVTLRNRIVVSPMCMYSSADGFAADWHLVHLGSRAVGGAALIIQEATAVSPEGRISDGDLGIWKDEHIEKLKQITFFIKNQGAASGIQLAHAGRKASCAVPWKGGAQIQASEPGGWETVGPSPIPFKEGQQPPAELDDAGIEKIKNDFRSATQRAKQAGYDVVEIHAAHGYLFHQFCSPLSNQRTDKYGGSFENRVRLLLEVTHIVRNEWTEGAPLFVRLSATDWVTDGWSIEDSVKLTRLLKDAGADFIDTSSGGNVATAKIPASPGYQVGFANKIKKQTGITTGTVGLITTSQQAEEILQQGQADLVFFAREMLRDPYFPLHAARELNEDVLWPVQYQRARI